LKADDPGKPNDQHNWHVFIYLCVIFESDPMFLCVACLFGRSSQSQHTRFMAGLMLWLAQLEWHALFELTFIPRGTLAN
jgi:hypothetical protein